MLQHCTELPPPPALQLGPWEVKGQTTKLESLGKVKVAYLSNKETSKKGSITVHRACEMGNIPLTEAK
jgi:hypothetical protein